MNLYFVAKDDLGCGFYRMFLPASVIKDNGIANVEVSLGYNPQIAEGADVIIFQRATDMSLYEEFIKLRAAGKKIVYEIDDLLYGITPEANAWGFWNPIVENQGRALTLMKMSDLVTVTTKRLGNEYGMHNRNIRILPNYLPAEKWNQPQGWGAEQWNDYYAKKNDSAIRIGWAGAANHKMDLELISLVMKDICDKYPQVRFTLMGYGPRELFPGIKIYDEIKSPDGQLEIIKGVPLMDYPAKLKSLAFDIGICPLVENGFNECKSDLKLKEYGAMGIPIVASNIKPYSISLVHGSFGYLASTAREWFDYLEILIQSEDMRNKMGKAAREYYERNTMDKHIGEWIKVYTELVNVKYEW